MEIVTERLVLIPCQLEVADALVRRDRDDAERLLGATLPHGWPDPEVGEILPMHADSLREHPEAVGYGVWLLVEREGRTVVGSSGFLGLPQDGGQIEIGYGIHADQRNRGYATEAVRALLEWGLAQPGVTRVIAHCDPGNAPSLRVVAKVGMREDGEDDGLTLWVASGELGGVVAG